MFFLFFFNKLFLHVCGNVDIAQCSTLQCWFRVNTLLRVLLRLGAQSGCKAVGGRVGVCVSVCLEE